MKMYCCDSLAGLELRAWGGRLKRAFTLIELVVAIAIVAVLAALLLPALSRAKMAANKARCQGNLRQIGAAAQMYMDDSDDWYPINDQHSLLHGELPLRAWTDFGWSWPYLGERSFAIWTCPQRNAQQQSLVAFDDDAKDCFPHEFLRAFAAVTYGAYCRLTGQPHRPRAGLIGFGDVNSLDLRVQTERDAGPDGRIGVYQHNHISSSTADGPGRHAGGQNMLFCDGHVEYGTSAYWNGEAERNHVFYPELPPRGRE